MAPTPKTRLQELSDTLGVDGQINVVDIGANPLNEPPYAKLLEANLCHVFGFEPQKEAFEKLQDSKSDHETYFPFPVGDGQTVDFHIYRKSGLSSTYSIDHKAREFLGRSERGSSLVETTKMDTKRLDNIDELPEIDLLKIDVQGSEVGIFRNGVQKLASAVAVITEVRLHRLYEDEPLMDVQFSELHKQGFIFHKFEFVKSVMLGNSQSTRLKQRMLQNQALDADAIFIRDISDPESVSSKQLRHLAVLADGVFESFDLVVKCLDILVERGEVDPELPRHYVDSLPPVLRKD